MSTYLNIDAIQSSSITKTKLASDALIVEKGSGTDSMVLRNPNSSSSTPGVAVAYGENSTSIGHKTVTGDSTKIDDTSSDRVGYGAFACGVGTSAIGRGAHSEGHDTVAQAHASHAEGGQTLASGEYSHVEGYRTDKTLTKGATGQFSHAEGYDSLASGIASHSEGNNTTAYGNYSHAEGRDTSASGIYSHSEGYSNTAIGEGSHAEGRGTSADGNYSHAEGYNTTASSIRSHAEGHSTTASNDQSHAEGAYSSANGNTSHAEGQYTIANNTAEHAEGKYNKSNTGTRHSIGIGSSDSDRKNAVEVMNNGNAYLYNVGNYDGTNPSSAISLNTLLNTIQVVNMESTYSGTLNANAAMLYNTYNNRLYTLCFDDTLADFIYNNSFSSANDVKFNKIYINNVVYETNGTTITHVDAIVYVTITAMQMENDIIGRIVV